MDNAWFKPITRSVLLVIVLGLFLQGCAALSAWGALSSVTGSGVSAHLDVGDKEISGTTVGSKEESKVDTKVEGVSAQREVKVDSSSQKKDQKTEIGEVHGNVEVVQGPSKGVMWFFYIGWIALAGIPIGLLFYFYKVSKRS